MAIGVNRLRAPPQERQLLGGRGPSTPQQRPTSSLPAPAHARPDGTQPTQERSTATPTTPRTPLQTCCPQRPRTAPTKTSRTSPADYRLPAIRASWRHPLVQGDTRRQRRGGLGRGLPKLGLLKPGGDTFDCRVKVAIRLSSRTRPPGGHTQLLNCYSGSSSRIFVVLTGVLQMVHLLS